MHKTNKMNKTNIKNNTKKIKYIVIVAVLLLIAIGALFIYKKSPLIITAIENSTKARATEVATESHILAVTLNQASYEEEIGDTFDISGIDLAITADGTTLVEFVDGSASKEYDSIGEKIELVMITDNYHNSKTVAVTIIVKDTQAPVISGVTDCRITEGRKFNALGGVAAIDNADGDVSDTLVCSAYDTDIVGTQTLTITAVDKSGNSSSIDFELEVLNKPVLAVETVPILEKTYLSVYKNVIPYDGKLRSITCWGDSLTRGHGADNSIVVGGISGATETTTLAKLTGNTVYNMGVNGEDSRTIASRQGGMEMYVNNITIPASGSVTFNEIVCEDGNVIDVARTDNNAEKECFNACTIGGITGKLSYDGDTNLYTFKRAVDGAELVIETNTAIITPTSIARRDDILVLEMGNNNGWEEGFGDDRSPSYDVLIAQYDAMIEYSTCKYFIIVGDTDGSQEERNSWDVALKQAYGDHYINMREYLVTNGLTDCGLVATSVDLEMSQLGEVPDSLKSDWSHLNSYGYYSKGKAIYAKGVQLGYWK